MTRGISPWRALAQSGISLKWEDLRPSGRGVCQNKKKQLVKTIRYTEIDTALPRLTYHAMRLEPGYTIQITHFLTGLWIGDIVVKVNGVLKSQFTWDDKGSHRH